MIPNASRWHFLAVKELASLLTEIISKNNRCFYCLICLHSFKTKRKLQSHKKVCKNKNFCNIIMPTAETKISQFNEYKKSDNAPFFDYADPECLIQRNDRCKNNLEKSFTRKVGKHILLGFFNVHNIIT